MLCCLAFVSPAIAAQIELTGRVVNETEAPVAAARVTIRQADAASFWVAQTEPTGVFKIQLPQPGHYLIHVEREGYYELKNLPVEADTSRDITLVINTLREVFQSLDVKEAPSPVNIEQSQNQEHLTGTEVNDVPYASSHNLRNSMPLLPGVVQDQVGGLHFNGASENQVLYLLNGFNVADPITGQFNTTLGVEGVRSMDFSSGRYSPEYGKGSAGVLSIRTDTGSDAFHYTATDFIPGVNINQGVRFGDWYPRVGVSGPIVAGRAWFADNFESEYNQSLITGLPHGQNTRTSWAGSNLLHTQVNITPRQILFGDFLINVENQTHYGLAPLDPVSTTQKTRGRQYFGSLKDQIYLGRGALIEFGYAHNYVADIQAPLGNGLYILTPDGRGGNYFVTSTQTAARDQFLADGYLPAFHFFGAHQIKAGADTDHLHYSGNFQRTGYELIGLAGTVLSSTRFAGSGAFSLPDTELSGYVLDNWRLSKRLQLDLGVRTDRDQSIHASGISPRLAFSWAPFASGNTRVAGGYAITNDAVNLGLLGRSLDQSAITTNYNPDGSVAGPPSVTTFVPPGRPLALPRAENWTASIDRKVSGHLFASARYLRRNETNGLTYVNSLQPYGTPFESPLPNTVLDGVFELTNLRRDRYESVDLTVHQTFTGQYEWMASFVHSRTLSNAVLDINSSDPLQIVGNLRPAPWDAPNRALAWAYLPLPWKNWAIAVLADARNGFPFSIQDDTGRVLGTIDAHRYPLNFDLNVSIERILTLRGYRFALRGGMNNVTNQRNPTAVDNVSGSPHFLQFYGLEGRHFVVRIRFFGRSATK
jgi:hypothetical protein